MKTPLGPPAEPPVCVLTHGAYWREKMKLLRVFRNPRQE